MYFGNPSFKCKGSCLPFFFVSKSELSVEIDRNILIKTLPISFYYFINFVVKTTDLLSTASRSDKTTAQSATAYTQPATAVINTEKASHHETNTKGDHFVVALSVSVATKAIIILAVVFYKITQ